MICICCWMSPDRRLRSGSPVWGCKVWAESTSTSVSPLPFGDSLRDEKLHSISTCYKGPAATWLSSSSIFVTVLINGKRIHSSLLLTISASLANPSDFHASWVAARRDGLHVVISVSDEGRGIPPEQLPRLFQKNVGFSNDEGRRTGLGLAICKGLVEAHGGRIWAASGRPSWWWTMTFRCFALCATRGRATLWL